MGVSVYRRQLDSPPRTWFWAIIVWEEITNVKANYVFKDVSKQKVENDRKRKASDDAKSSWNAAKYKKTNDNSLQARNDYAQQDGGPGVCEVHTSVPQVYFQSLMMDFYRANVKVTEAK